MRWDLFFGKNFVFLHKIGIIKRNKNFKENE